MREYIIHHYNLAGLVVVLEEINGYRDQGFQYANMGSIRSRTLKKHREKYKTVICCAFG
jgi:hypothetical protein